MCKNVNINSMVKSRIYYDGRRPTKDGKGHLRVVLNLKGESAMVSLGISIFAHQWENEEIVKHPDADLLNKVISIKKGTVNRCLLELSATGGLEGMTVQKLAEIIKGKLDPSYAEKKKKTEEEAATRRRSFLLFFESKVKEKKNHGTKTLYYDTLHKIESFCRLQRVEPTTLTFEDITKTWLTSFEQFCLNSECQNTASRHLRDIRAIINCAIDEDLTSNYPFRRFKIKKEETLDKSYSAEELRRLFSHNCYPGGEQESVDIFKLMFCLIGINCIDLFYATKAQRGRLTYVRAKTHKPYSIKIEPEAAEIINKYSGRDYLLNIIDRSPNYKTYFNRMGKTLRKVGKVRIDGKRSEGDAILPDICTGSARTSWGTIAQEELDIPRDVIAAALGHHTVDVTSTYLRTDWKKKVDEANRKVLDWVFHQKKS